MTVITIKSRAVFVGSKCIEDDARTKDDAYNLAVDIEASMKAIGQPCEIRFAGQA